MLRGKSGRDEEFKTNQKKIVVPGSRRRTPYPYISYRGTRPGPGVRQRQLAAECLLVRPIEIAQPQMYSREDGPLVVKSICFMKAYYPGLFFLQMRFL